MSFTDGDDEHATMDAASFNTHLFEQMRCMHLQWLEKLREIRDLELDYGASLAATKSPSEAVLLCSEWMAKRLEIIAHEQRVGGREEDNIAGRNFPLKINRTLRQYQSNKERKNSGESLRPRDTHKPNTGISQQGLYERRIRPGFRRQQEV